MSNPWFILLLALLLIGALVLAAVFWAVGSLRRITQLHVLLHMIVAAREHIATLAPELSDELLAVNLDIVPISSQLTVLKQFGGFEAASLESLQTTLLLASTKQTAADALYHLERTVRALRDGSLISSAWRLRRSRSVTAASADAGALKPDEAALLAGLIEKFYGSASFKFMGLAMVACVLLAGSGVIFLGKEQINLKDQLEKAAASAVADIRQQSVTFDSTVELQTKKLDGAATDASKKVADASSSFQQQLVTTQTRLFDGATDLLQKSITRVMDEINTASSPQRKQIDQKLAAAVTDVNNLAHEVESARKAKDASFERLATLTQDALKTADAARESAASAVSSANAAATSAAAAKTNADTARANTDAASAAATAALSNLGRAAHGADAAQASQLAADHSESAAKSSALAANASADTASRSASGASAGATTVAKDAETARTGAEAATKSAALANTSANAAGISLETITKNVPLAAASADAAKGSAAAAGAHAEIALRGANDATVNADITKAAANAAAKSATAAEADARRIAGRGPVADEALGRRVEALERFVACVTTPTAALVPHNEAELDDAGRQRIQLALQRRGFGPSTADGKFGSATAAARDKFQRSLRAPTGREFTADQIALLWAAAPPAPPSVEHCAQQLHPRTAAGAAN